MAFSLSGSTITQTGTDVVTSTSTIPGTTKSTVRNRVTQFNFGGKTLVVNGTLTMPEKIRFTNLVLGTTSTGTLNVGEIKTNPVDYKYCDGMDALETVGTATQTFTNLTLNVFGQRVFFTSGYLSLNQPFRFEHAHVVVQGRFNLSGNGYIARNTRITTCGLNVNPIIFILANTGGWESTIVDSTQSGQDLYFALSNLTPGGTYAFENIGLATGQSLMGYGQQSAPGPTFNVYQLSVGAAYTLVQTAGRYYILNLYHRFIDTVSDAAGNPVQDAVVYLDGGAGTAIHALTDSAGQAAQAFLYHSNTLFKGVETRTEYLSGNTITKRIASYLHLLPAASSFDVRTATPSVASLTLVGDPSLTQTDRATVDAYATLETSAKFYDRAKSWLVDNYTGQATTLVSRSGTLIDAGGYNVTIDATAAQAFAIAGNTITIKASTYTGDMTTTGVITLANGAQFIGTRTDANGTIAPPNTVSITGITAGSRLQIYNVTTATEVINTTVAGTSYSATYLEGTNYSAGDLIRVRLTYTNGATAKLPYEGQVLAGSSGWALLVSQQDDTVYNGLGIDGSSVTEFVEDCPNIQVDINDPDGATTVERLYAWFVDAQTTADGVRNWFGGIVPEDAANFRVITDILDLQIDNLSATGVAFSDGRRLYRDDGASPLVSSTTGGGSITLYAGKVYTSVISTASPVITGDIADVPAAVQSGMTAQGYTTARAPKLDSLDATVSSRLAASAYVEPLDATETQAAAAAALTAYDAVQPADLAGLATASALNAVGAAIIAEVDAIPTNPLLASDTRLDNLDATVSSRLPTSAYIAPTDAPTASETATAVRAELATELGRIDATVSSRLATSGYTAPANSDIAAIKAKTDTLVNGPTLAQIEGSSVLAKEATLASKASQTSVDALPTVADLAVVNEGVKKASLLIPHSTNLP